MLRFSLIAQNLVPNYSYEQHSQCPDSENQITRSIGWESYCASPDYFNACSTNAEFSVPSNLLGSYQPASTGSAYAGFYAYWSPCIGNGYKNLRENIGRQLVIPMVIGTKYYISFKVSLADNGSVTSANCATNNIGIKFSTVPYNIYADSTNTPMVNNFAHIYETTLITDTVGWATISGSFIADSSYNYLIIGNFFKDVNTDTLILHTSQIYCRAYYYVDDVCVSTDSLTCNATGVNEIQLQNAVKIYPNPFSNSTTLKFDDGFHFNNCKIMLYDFLGEELRNYEMKSNQLTIERNGLPDGIYLLNVQINNQIYSQKLIITN